MSNITLKKIVLRNFQSFGNNYTEIDLSSTKSTLILGENLDTGGNNGAGKSTLINAICYILYNKPLEDITLKNLVNDINSGKKTLMEVRLFFSKGDVEYEIYRSNGTSVNVQVIENGHQITQAGNADKQIVDILGISYNLFTKVVIFDGDVVPFLKCKVADQRDLVEELFKITVLTEKADKLKLISKDTEQSIKVQEAVIKQKQSQIDSHIKQINEAEQRVKRWDIDKVDRISKLENEIQLLKTINFEEEKQLHQVIKDLEVEIHPLNLELSEINNKKNVISGDKNALNSDKNSLRNEKNTLLSNKVKFQNDKVSLEKEIISLTGEIEKLEKEIEHLELAQCPYCMQDWFGQAAVKRITDKKELRDSRSKLLIEKSDKKNINTIDSKILEINSMTDELDKAMVELDKAMAELDLLIVEIQKEATGVESKIKDIKVNISEVKQCIKYSSIEEVIKAESSTQSVEEKLQDVIKSENPHIEAYDQLKNQPTEDIMYDELNELKKLLEHQQFLIKLLTNKDSFVRKNILNMNIPFLNSKLAKHTKDLGLPHTVKFDNDMGCTVSKYGREIEYSSLSKGEKKRVNLSLAFAFREVLHFLHAHVNAMFMDEIDGSLDTQGVESMFKFIKQKSRDDNMGLWIISHRPEAVGRFDKTVIFRKENSFSSFIEG
jgi:DNA repair exonuclease SbcCD ATPase subunit